MSSRGACPARPRADATPELWQLALRASAGRGPYAEAARNVVLTILLAQLLSGADHEGPPHAPRRAPRHDRSYRHRLPHRASLSGRRPRG